MHAMHAAQASHRLPVCPSARMPQAQPIHRLPVLGKDPDDDDDEVTATLKPLRSRIAERCRAEFDAI